MKFLKLISVGFASSNIFALFSLIIGLLSLIGPISVESRSSGNARVLTGGKRVPSSESDTVGMTEWAKFPQVEDWRGNLSSTPFTETATVTVTQASDFANQPSLYLLPPPMQPIAGTGAGPTYVVAAATNEDSVVAPNNNYNNYNNNNFNVHKVVDPQPPAELEKAQEYIYSQTEKPFVPLSIPSIANHRLTGNWSEEVKVGGNEIQTAASGLKPVYPGKPKVRRKVNVEKFRECIFFRICKKSECFHFGRFGVCQGY